MVKHDLSSHHFQREISDFCKVRIAPIASKRVLESIRPYLIGLVIHRRPPPIRNGRMDWTAIGQACGIEGEWTAELKKALRPGLDAIIRWLVEPPATEDIRPTNPRAKSTNIAPRKSDSHALEAATDPLRQDPGSIFVSAQRATTETNQPIP